MTNFFARTESFEAVRAAALQGATSFERALRRFESQSIASDQARQSILIDERTSRMLKLAIASSKAVLLAGPPGTGKTELLAAVIADAMADPESFGFGESLGGALWVTPEEEWSYERMVLGTTVNEAGQLVSTEGFLLDAIHKDEWLILDETNRADLDRVLGGALTWLSNRPVQIGTWIEPNCEPLPVTLEWAGSARSSVDRTDGAGGRIRYRAGQEWRLLGTYNAVDAQRVFRMGQALNRRFRQIPILPMAPDKFLQVALERLSGVQQSAALAERLSLLYSAHYDSDVVNVGPAMFLDMANYLRAALEGDLAEADGDSDGSVDSLTELDDPTEVADPATKNAQPVINAPSHDALLAEAYLSSAGSVIARLDLDELNDLGAIVEDHDLFSSEDWSWILAGLSALRG